MLLGIFLGLLYLYYNGKLRLPRKTRDSLQHFEEIQLTDMELELYQNYSPFLICKKPDLRVFSPSYFA